MNKEDPDHQYYKLFVKPKYVQKSKKLKHEKFIRLFKPKLKMTVHRWFKLKLKKEQRQDFLNFLRKLEKNIASNSNQSNELRKNFNPQDKFYQLALWGKTLFLQKNIVLISLFLSSSQSNDHLMYKRLCTSLMSFMVGEKGETTYNRTFSIKTLKREENDGNLINKIKKQHFQKLHGTTTKFDKTFTTTSRFKKKYDGFSRLGTQMKNDYENRHSLLETVNATNSFPIAGKGSANRSKGIVFNKGRFEGNTTQKDHFKFRNKKVEKPERMFHYTSTSVGRTLPGNMKLSLPDITKQKLQTNQKKIMGGIGTGTTTYSLSYGKRKGIMNNKISTSKPIRSKKSDWQQKCPFGVLVGSKFSGENYFKPVSRDYYSNNLNKKIRPNTALGLGRLEEYRKNRNILNGPTCI